MKLKEIRNNIVAGAMSLFIFVSPFLPSRSNRIRLREIDNTDKAKIVDNVDTRNRDFKLEIDGIESIYDYDYEKVSFNSNLPCNEELDFNQNDVRSIYDKATSLLNKVKDNSNMYINSNTGYVLGFVGTNIDDPNIQDKILVQYIFKNLIIDILEVASNKDVCLISDLKLLISYDNKETSLVKYFNNDNLIVVYPNNIRKINEQSGTYFYDTLKYELEIILNRIRLNRCSCHDNNTSFPYRAIGDAAVYSSLSNSETVVDDYKTQSESLILLLGLFNNVNIRDYYNSIFSGDINLFNELFCDNNRDIDNLNRILYEIDLNYNGESHFDYRVDIFKMVISDMMWYTSNNRDFKLKDNLILFNCIRSLVVNRIGSNSLDRDEYDNINRINNLYIEFLGKYYSKDIDYVINILNSKAVINYSRALIDLCNNDIYYEELYFEYSDYSMVLLERFPLLRDIFKNNDVDVLGYDKFIKKKDGLVKVR